MDKGLGPGHYICRYVQKAAGVELHQKSPELTSVHGVSGYIATAHFDC